LNRTKTKEIDQKKMLRYSLMQLMPLFLCYFSLSTANNACMLSMPTGTTVFDACATFTSLGIDVYWSKNSETATNSGNTLVDFGFSGTTSGYAAIGFPATPNIMVGATAIIAAPCDSCSPTGATIGDYYLAGYRSSDIIESAGIPVTNMKASSTSTGSGLVTATFTVELPTSNVDSRSTNIILAEGPVSSSGEFLDHRGNYSSGNINLLSNNNNNNPNITSTSMSSVGQAHAWLMTVGFGVLMPLGVIAAIGLRAGYGPGWFEYHRYIMFFAFVVVVAGFATGFVYSDEKGEVERTSYDVHSALGITAFVLVALNIVAGLVRPGKDHKKRGIWNAVHHNMGRIGLILAIINIYYALLVVEDDIADWTYIAYSAVLGVMAVVMVGMYGCWWMGGGGGGGVVVENGGVEMQRKKSGGSTNGNVDE
jgi:cytochrome b561